MVVFRFVQSRSVQKIKMPSTNFPKQKVLRSFAGLISNQASKSVLGNSDCPLSSPFSTLAANRIHPNRTADIRAAITFLLSNNHSIHIPSIASQSNIMSSCSSCGNVVGLGARQLESQGASSGQVLNSGASRNEICFGSRSVDYCRRVSGSLKNRQPWGNNMVYKCFWSDATSTGWKSSPFVEPWLREFYSSSSAATNDAGAAPDVLLDGASQEEKVGSHGSSSDRKLLGDRTLKLLSGSSYLPHPDKEETGGEDAHFICIDDHAVGVADGVGGWADLGVDAGQYARELMSHSVSAIQEEPKGAIDTARVLEKAYSSTKARGSSTACIIALTDQVFSS